MKTNKYYELSFMIVIALLFCFPIINAGIYYRDDLDRATTGLYGWSVLGRPLADLLYAFITAGSERSADIFPLSIIVSAAGIGLACYALHKYLLEKEVKHSLIISSMMAFNPYMLQNLFYRFDAPGMVCSFLICVWAFCRFESVSYKNILINAFCIVVALSLYQTCTNIVIALMALEILITSRKLTFRKSLFLFIGRSASYILGYVIYMLTVAKVWGGDTNRSETLNPEHLLAGLIKNFRGVNNLLSQFLYHTSFYYVAVAFAIGVLTYITLFAKENKTIKGILGLVIFVVLFYISLLGPMIVLKNAPLAPRSLVSFSILFVGIAYMLSCYKNIIYITLLPFIASMSFSAQAGNALKAQRNYEQHVIYSIKDDLRNQKGVKDVRFVGQINYSPFALRAKNNSPLIDAYISRASEWLAAFQLNEAGVRGVNLGYGRDAENRKLLSMAANDVVSVSYDYRILRFNDIAIIEFGTYSP